MKTRTAAAVCALMLGAVAAPGVAPAQALPDAELTRLADAPLIDLTATGRLYDRAVVGGTLATLHDRLDATARSATSPGARARARLIQAGLYWRAGEAEAAMAAVDAGLVLAPGFDAWLMKAELTDIADPASAAAWYRRAQSAAPDAARRRRIALRLAVMDALTDPGALTAYARSNPSAPIERIADVVAMLGKPGDAVRLSGDAAPRDIAGRFRRAGWAAAAGDAATTRAEAWQAYRLARDAGDQRYALALLVEGYRMAGDLRGAAAFLAQQPPSDEIVGMRVDVLLEGGRLPEAAALARGARDPDTRRRLIGILDLTGDAAAGEAEYRRLIAAAPAKVDNYVGLAAVYLGKGDEARAQAVFRQVFDANRGDPDALADIARRMIDMGLGDAALSLIGSGSAAATSGDATRLLLFRTYLNRGDEAKARAELDALVARKPSDAVLGDAIDGYLALQDPARALALLRRLEGAGRPLDYDRLVQLATLAARTGAVGEALDRWLAVWRDATLPARRNYAEQQIVRLALATDRLRTLTDDSAARLRTGRLRAGEFDLLLTLRLAANDRRRALEDIQVLIGRGDVAALQQAARGYARLNDQTALQATLRRLVAADPANRADYLQQLILTTVRYGEGTPDVRRAQLERLLGELPDRGSPAAASFRGSVFAMAGLGDDAVAQYRLAGAAASADGDATLRLADALRKQRREGEALTLLQFVAEAAESDDAVTTALDGMLDLVASDALGFVTLETSRTEVLRWIERRAVEQMVARGDSGRLQGILGDTAAALDDVGLQLRIYEAALPDAGGQRPILLRRLIALTSEPQAGGAAAARPVQAGRKLLYARRLLALRKAFPPDFYADIAATMLRQGDRAGAEGAFAMMSDAGDLVNVDEVRGRAYAAAGMADAALVSLGRALIRDSANLDLLVDTSILRETRGDRALAFRWYWRAAERLIARQPAGVADGRGDQGFDFGRFGPTIFEGAMLTWPTDAAGRTAALADLRRLSDAAVATIDAAAPGALSEHGRLSAVLDLSRRVEAAGHDDAVATALAGRLDGLFARDPGYRRGAGYFDALQGRADPVAGTGLSWVGAALVRQAILADNVTLATALAIRTDDTETMRTVLSGALAADAAWNAAIAANNRAAGRPPQTIEILSQLIQGLPPERIRATILPLIQAAPQRETLLFDLYRQQAKDYEALAAAIGADPMPDSRLIELLVTRGNTPLGGSARVGSAWGDPWQLDRFDIDEQLDLLDRLVTRIELGAPPPPLTISTIRSLLARPLTAAQQATLKAVLLRDVAFIRDPARRSIAPLLDHLLHPRAAPGNRALLLDVADAAVRRYPDATALPLFLRAAFAGDIVAAGRQLDALEAGLATAVQGRDPFAAARAALASPAPGAATAPRPAGSPPPSPARPDSATPPLVATLVAAQRTAPATVPALLRAAWRATPVDVSQRRGLVRGLLAATEAGPDALAWKATLARPDVLAELEAYPIAMDAETRHAMSDLFALVARGLAVGGTAGGRLDALRGRLAAQTIGASEVQLLIALAAEAGTALDAATTATLVDGLRRTPALAADERLRLAEVLVRSGDAATATELASAALDQTMYPLTPLDNAANGAAVVASLSRWADRPAARRAYDRLVAQADRFRATPAGAFYAALPPLAIPGD